MIKKALEQAERVLTEKPASDPQSIEEYLENLHKVSRNLDGIFIHPRTAIGDGSYMKAAELKEDIDNQMYIQQANLQAVIAEEPSMDVDDSVLGITQVPDIRATCEELALRSAQLTAGMNLIDRRRVGMEQFYETVEPFLPEPTSYDDPSVHDIPRTLYASMLEEYFAMPVEKLADVGKIDPKDIKSMYGPDPTPSSGVDPSPSDQDPASGTKEEGGQYPKAQGPNQETTVWNDILQKEREYRKIPDNSPSKEDAGRSNDKQGAIKIALIDPPEELKEHGIDPDSVKNVVQDVAEVTVEAGVRTYWVEHEGQLFGFDESDVMKLTAADEEEKESGEEDKREEQEEPQEGMTPPDEVEQPVAPERQEPFHRDQEEKLDEAAFPEETPGNADPVPADQNAGGGLPEEHGNAPVSNEPDEPLISEGEPEASSVPSEISPPASSPEVSGVPVLEPAMASLECTAKGQFVRVATVDEDNFPARRVGYAYTSGATPPSKEVEGKSGMITASWNRGGFWVHAVQMTDGKVHEFVDYELDPVKMAVEDKSGVEPMDDKSKAPPVGEPFEKHIEEEGDGKQSPKPVGPNRRRPSDVKSYSTPAKDLTSSLNEVKQLTDEIGLDFNEVVKAYQGA